VVQSDDDGAGNVVIILTGRGGDGDFLGHGHDGGIAWRSIVERIRIDGIAEESESHAEGDAELGDHDVGGGGNVVYRGHAAAARYLNGSDMAAGEFILVAEVEDGFDGGMSGDVTGETFHQNGSGQIGFAERAREFRGIALIAEGF